MQKITHKKNSNIIQTDSIKVIDNSSTIGKNETNPASQSIKDRKDENKSMFYFVV